MKTIDPRDPLDRRIDALLAARPIQPSTDFRDRVLAAVEAEADAPRGRSILPFVLPLAAAFAIALTLLQFAGRPPATQAVDPLAQIEPVVQEALLLEDGLVGLGAIESEDFEIEGLLATFDALYNDIQS